MSQDVAVWWTYPRVLGEPCTLASLLSCVLMLHYPCFVSVFLSLVLCNLVDGLNTAVMTKLLDLPTKANNVMRFMQPYY